MIVDLTCDNCGNLFTRTLATHRRNVKRGCKSTSCSRQCANSLIRRPSKEAMAEGQRSRWQNLDPLQKQRELNTFIRAGQKAAKEAREKRYGRGAKFRVACGNAERRSRSVDLPFNLTPEFLADLWHEQAGKCAYTQWDMHIRGPKDMRTASIDRTVPSLGYVKTNVKFVCLAVNIAKHTWTTDEFLNLCRSVV